MTIQEMASKYGFELFYSCGGHGGPYWTFEEAQSAARAKLRGMPTMQAVSIVERTPYGIGGYGMIVEKIKQGE